MAIDQGRLSVLRSSISLPHRVPLPANLTIVTGALRRYGASKAQMLKDVEVPLALPSIMAGANQTILMCLSMVVIISLIGGGGLGKSILEALQYAAKGPGLLGGFAILFCAITIDRIVQGAFSGKRR